MWLDENNLCSEMWIKGCAKMRMKGCGEVKINDVIK